MACIASQELQTSGLLDEPVDLTNEVGFDLDMERVGEVLPAKLALERLQVERFAHFFAFRSFFRFLSRSLFISFSCFGPIALNAFST